MPAAICKATIISGAGSLVLVLVTGTEHLRGSVRVVSPGTREFGWSIVAYTTKHQWDHLVGVISSDFCNALFTMIPTGTRPSALVNRSAMQENDLFLTRHSES